MKRILGLDLGVTSIGWAMLEENEGNRKILGMGSRIVPLNPDDKDEFTSGNAISKNQKRTTKRTQRKGYDRYQLRTANLKAVLESNTLLPVKSLMELPPLELYRLRSKAPNEKISLPEFGRVLYLLNQKRGYKSSRSDANLGKKDTDYVTEVKSRHQQIKDRGITIGQHFFEGLSSGCAYRIKEQVFPREAYIEEFDAICNEQKKHYPGILTDELIAKLRNEIVYYQRNLKSQKGLVSICEFAGFKVAKDNKEIFVGPKVAPKSSPLFQVCKIWESINNVTLKNKHGEILDISNTDKQKIFDHLDNHEKLSQNDLFKLLNLRREDGWYGNKLIEIKGLQGNLTKVELTKRLKGYEHLLEFVLKIDSCNENVFLVDQKTGEQLGETKKRIVSADFERQPLYQLWHVIYSISDPTECSRALQMKFDLPADISDALANIDFTKAAFGNKSAKAIRKILPYLMDGYVYSEACALAGFNHSDSKTSEQRLNQNIYASLEILPKNTLRQPIVEKILNQLINLINALIQEYGTFTKDDEIRIELARELKQSKDERNEAYSSINKRERENKAITERIEKEYAHLGVRATRNTIIKWRLFHEICGDEQKVNATCIYCGQPFGISDALRGDNIDIEHIIPKSRLFDDSQSNKTLVHRKCNTDKDDRTAFDFMNSKGGTQFAKYIETVASLYKDGVINKSKRDKLLMPIEKIPQDFIDRQLRQTQYIARKSKELLEKICPNVWSTSGSVTQYLRHIWGWDDVLMNLQLPKYRTLGLTSFQEWEDKDGRKHKKEVIEGWTKRNDHRHHAIDALAIACTRHGYVQRINTLSAEKTRNQMYDEVKESGREFNGKKSLLENYIFNVRPFTTKQVEDAAVNILISFKAGKKVATIGKRKVKVDGKKQVVQRGIVVPRGALSEESVYGRIKTIERNKPAKFLFENPGLILKPYIKELVEERIAKYNGDVKAAFASTKKDPLYLDKEKNKRLEYGTCFKDEYVIKYPIQSLKAKDADFIIDEGVKALVKERLAQHGNKEKEAFKETLWYNKELNIPIRTIRCFTGLTAVEPLKRDETGREIGFVKPGNNHHIAFYADENGEKQEHVCSFWHAVERVKYGIPAIVQNPKDAWDRVLASDKERPESFLSKLPKDNWNLLLTLQQNEMYILGLSADELNNAIAGSQKALLSQHLYRVQKIAKRNYVFRHHLETEIDDSKNAALAKRYYLLQSIDALFKLNPTKVSVTNLGEIKEHT